MPTLRFAARKAFVSSRRPLPLTVVTGSVSTGSKLKSNIANLRRPLAARAGVRWEGLAADGPRYRIGGRTSRSPLLALTRCPPLARTAFLLHDVLNTPFPRSRARMLDRTEAACSSTCDTIPTRGAWMRPGKPGGNIDSGQSRPAAERLNEAVAKRRRVLSPDTCAPMPLRLPMAAAA